MTQMIPAMIMGFREGLEAFLVIAVILRYLSTIGKTQLKAKVYQGGVAGIIGSYLLGLGLFMAANRLGGVDTLSKAWESGASLIALILVTTFIVWMIRHGSQMTANVREQISQNLSTAGVFLIAFAMVMREGTEIAVFFVCRKIFSLCGISWHRYIPCSRSFYIPLSNQGSYRRYISDNPRIPYLTGWLPNWVFNT